MNRHLFSLPAIRDWCFRLLGLDVVIERCSDAVGFWEFSHEPLAHDGVECWGLGLHLMVSRWGAMSTVR